MGRHTQNKNFAYIPIMKNNYLFFYYPIFSSFQKKIQLQLDKNKNQNTISI